MAARRKSDQELLRELTAEPDGLPVRAIGAWTLKKLAVLLLYFEPFTRACGKAGGGHYIDGFAGPGMCEIREAPGPIKLVWGSPLLALRTQPPFEQCVFVEQDAVAAEALSERIHGSVNRSAVRVGDANDLVPAIVCNEVPGWAPCLCFLDPEAAELNWSTVRQVAQTPGRNRMPELLILFTLPMGPQRMLTTRGSMDPTWEAVLDRYFPDGGWRDVYRDRLADKIAASEARDQYLRIYKGGLKKLGYADDGIYSLPVRMPGQPGGRGRELYHLIFASDHPAGKRIMKYVLERQNWLDHLAMGRLPLFPEA